MLRIIRNAPQKLWSLLQMLWWILTAKEGEKENRDHHDQILSFAPILHEDIWYVEGAGDLELLATVLGASGFVDTVVMGDDITTVSIFLVPDITIKARVILRDRLITQEWRAIPAAEVMSLEKLRGMLPVNIRHANLK